MIPIALYNVLFHYFLLGSSDRRTLFFCLGYLFYWLKSTGWFMCCFISFSVFLITLAVRNWGRTLAIGRQQWMSGWYLGRHVRFATGRRATREGGGAVRSGGGNGRLEAAECDVRRYFGSGKGNTLVICQAWRGRGRQGGSRF